ncbi:MAG: DUF3445 domain-containing protein [Pseudomonadota bacterium]
MMDVLHKSLPHDMRVPRALPGVQPVTGSWLRWDEAFGGQMQRREEILRDHRHAVVYLEENARTAAAELLEEALAEAAWPREGDRVQRPDGVWVTLDLSDPMGTLGRLFQSDFVIMDRPEGRDAHVLVAAVLCFPASWTLAEKAGRALADIHIPVEDYDDQLARRVQRLFDGVQVGRPLWRFNALWYHDAELFQPQRRTPPKGQETAYYRSERQTILRLPRTRACVFVIHTYVLRAEDVL